MFLRKISFTKHLINNTGCNCNFNIKFNIDISSALGYVECLGLWKLIRLERYAESQSSVLLVCAMCSKYDSCVCKQGKTNKPGPPEAQSGGKKDKKVCFLFKLLLEETFSC